MVVPESEVAMFCRRGKVHALIMPRYVLSVAELPQLSTEALVRQAAQGGAQVILLQELFETPYFCIEQDSRHLRLATTLEENPAVAHFAGIARELGVVLPISFFERAGRAYFNSVAMLDADGSVLGLYRKSHIPNGPGYQEKNYFSPGDTGFRVWQTPFGRIGVGICWDQWFPECARVMALAGAELLLYPTAIGTEPPPALPVLSRDHWQRTQQGGHGGHQNGTEAEETGLMNGL
jgi:N-carbamoylputrescine amidase